MCVHVCQTWSWLKVTLSDEFTGSTNSSSLLPPKKTKKVHNFLQPRPLYIQCCIVYHRLTVLDDGDVDWCRASHCVHLSSLHLSISVGSSEAKKSHHYSSYLRSRRDYGENTAGETPFPRVADDAAEALSTDCVHPCRATDLSEESFRWYMSALTTQRVYSDVLLTCICSEVYPRKKLVADGGVLYGHLVSRKTVSRVQESKRRKGQLRMVPGMYVAMCVYLFNVSHHNMICIVKLWSEKQRVSSKETVESVLRYIWNTLVVENTVCISGCVCVS